LIPASSFEQLPAVPSVSVHIAEHGGHLGYVAGKTADPDRRWMDWRVIDWLAKHLRFSRTQS
jgi:predicted alpha/beta-fold hydrolase